MCLETHKILNRLRRGATYQVKQEYIHKYNDRESFVSGTGFVKLWFRIPQDGGLLLSLPPTDILDQIVFRQILGFQKGFCMYPLRLKSSFSPYRCKPDDTLKRPLNRLTHLSVSLVQCQDDKDRVLGYTGTTFGGT
jgi:hypothetical protein